MHNRVSRGTTMGFITLDGVLMGTRPGRLDPGVLLYLLRERGMSVQALEHLLYHECGLLGVSGGISSDMRELSASQAPEARDAIALFVRSVVRETAILGGVDALVFTGGIGEHACEVRDAILDGCAWLGLTRDQVTPPRSAARLSPRQRCFGLDDPHRRKRHHRPPCARAAARPHLNPFTHLNLRVARLVHCTLWSRHVSLQLNTFQRRTIGC